MEKAVQIDGGNWDYHHAIGVLNGLLGRYDQMIMNGYTLVIGGTVQDKIRGHLLKAEGMFKLNRPSWSTI